MPLDSQPTPLAPLVIVSGPSGVGKTTVVDTLIARAALPLRRAVTATTREPRPGERPDIDYHFWTSDEFRREIDAGRMLEWAVVFGRDYYGTPRGEVDPHRATGTGVILVIDVQGAATVRGRYPNDHLSVFLAPPGPAELEARLRGRGDLSEERLLRRLETARQELARQGEFDRVIVNATVGEAVGELERLVREEFRRRGLPA
jgi:guanylate kinase